MEAKLFHLKDIYDTEWHFYEQNEEVNISKREKEEQICGKKEDN